MSSVRSEDAEVIAILLADIHLSLKPPIWRSPEVNEEGGWFGAMFYALAQVEALKRKYKCPVLCAGDIFDKWDSKPEIVNFALRYLPDMYSIAGQHGLPQHNYDDLDKSAYQTLVHAGKIHDLLPNELVGLENLVLCGFPFGHRLKPLPREWKRKNKVHVAVVHDYVWIPDCSYPGAPPERRVHFNKLRILGYDVIMFGDNHRGFWMGNKQGVQIFNCGTLMRRKLDEDDYKPQVGLLLRSGEVRQHFLDISKDVHLDAQAVEMGGEELDMSDFMEELEKLGDTALDFVEAMKRFLRKHKISKEVATILLKAMGL